MQELLEQINNGLELEPEIINEYIEKEKHQIMVAWADGCFESKPGDCGMNYYKNKFIKNEQRVN